MISIGSFKDINNSYDEIWIIVRSLKNGIPQIGNCYHVPQLSPLWDLFRDYCDWSKKGIWNEKCFMERYVPRFLKQMHSTEAKYWLNLLYNKSKEGKNILLVCFCSNEKLCHRSIVCGLLQGVGSITSADDYSHYYQMYKEV